jgi:hypothetical protein
MLLGQMMLRLHTKQCVKHKKVNSNPERRSQWLMKMY